MSTFHKVKPACGSWSSTWSTLKNWENAFVSGNGRMGAMVFGQPDRETLVGNHCRLFLTQPYAEKIPYLADTLSEFRRIFRENGWCQDGAEGAAKYWWDKAVERLTHENKQMTDPVHPGFFMTIDSYIAGEVQNYIRSVDFTTGEVIVRFTDEDGVWLRRTFVSRQDNLIVTSITRPEVSAPFDLTVSANVEHARIQNEVSVDDSWIGHHNVYTEGKGGYDTGIRVYAPGGHTKKAGDTIQVNGAQEVLIMAKIVPWKCPANPEKSDAWAYSPENPDFAFENCDQYEPAPLFGESSVVAYKKEETARKLLPQIRASMENVTADYDQLFAPHAEAHSDLFNRVTVDFNGDAADRCRSGEELLNAAQGEERLSPALLERMYDAGRFMFICSSGERPPALQGIWTATWEPKWSGDFTVDTNEQLAVLVGLGGNLPELMAGHCSLVEEAKVDFRTNATRYYGCRGLMGPIRMSNDGLHLHWGKRSHGQIAPWVCWTGAAGWLAHFFYDYYLYTEDLDFLEKSVAPLVKEICLFYYDFVIENPNTGKWQFIPSLSPETGPGIDATMDIMIAKQMVRTHIEICRTLQCDADNIPEWEAFLDKMPDYRLNEDGALAEFLDLDSPCKRYEHRHSSHLYGPQYDPLTDISEDKPELWDAAREATYRKVYANGENDSHGQMHAALSAAFLRMPEPAWDCIASLAVERAMYPSMITAHNPGPNIFNCDANGAMPEVVHRMIFYAVPGHMDLLPALPSSLPVGEIKGVLARGRIHVDRLSWNTDEKHISLTLTSGKDQNITVRLPNAISIQVQEDISQTEKTNAVDVYLPAEQEVTRNISWF